MNTNVSEDFSPPIIFLLIMKKRNRDFVMRKGLKTTQKIEEKKTINRIKVNLHARH